MATLARPDRQRVCSHPVRETAASPQAQPSGNSALNGWKRGPRVRAAASPPRHRATRCCAPAQLLPLCARKLLLRGCARTAPPSQASPARLEGGSGVRSRKPLTPSAPCADVSRVRTASWTTRAPRSAWERWAAACGTSARACTTPLEACSLASRAASRRAPSPLSASARPAPRQLQLLLR
jgi:hypothetical protein